MGWLPSLEARITKWLLLRAISRDKLELVCFQMFRKRENKKGFLFVCFVKPHVGIFFLLILREREGRKGVVIC